MKEECQMKWTMLLMLAVWAIGVSAQEVSHHAASQVDSLILVSRDLTSSSEFDQALEVSAAAEQIALSGQPGMGSGSAAYGKCCFNKGRILHIRGDFQNAEEWYVQSRSIQEKALGKEHPDYAWSLNNLAALYQGLGRYEEAISLHLESRAIREKTLGKEHGDYLKSLNNLALLYQALGRLEEAVSLLLEAISIQERTIGRDHPDFAVSLLNLAMDYVIMGQYDKIEPLYLEARAIQEKALGPDHPHLAVCLNDMGAFYEKLGQYEKAEPLYRQALSIKEHAWGKLHPQYAISLLQLANLYTGQDRYELAEPLYLEVKFIREKAFGQEHPDYANSLYNLGIFYTRQGQYQKAEPYFLETLSIQEHVLGKENRAYGWSLYYLADLNEKKGQYENAESQFLAAAQIWKTALGEQHPHYAYALYRLAHLFEVQSRYAEAQAVLTEVLPLTQKRIAGGVSFLSEQELASFAIRQQSNTPVNAFLLARPADQTGELPALSYDQVLFEKGFLLQTASRLQALATATPEAAAIHSDLQAIRGRIARELATPGADRQGLKAIEEEANALEQQLSRTVAGYAAALRQVKWQEVQSVLPSDAVALEFVHFQVNFPIQTDRVQYAAFLLHPGTPAPQFIPLCEESAFQQLLAANKERKADYVNELYAWNDRGLVEENTKSASLYALIWQQIEAAGLEGVRTVYYSPSGLLHRLNLGAIAVDDETILSDHYNLVALNSTRQLVIPSAVRVEANDAMLAGGVNFEADPGDQPIEEQELLASRSAASAWEEVGSRGGTWMYLKWTEKEVERIGTTLTADGFHILPYTGSQASEEVFKEIGMAGPSPRVLHMATHGFFFPDPEVQDQRSGLDDAEPVFKWSDNPMIRSGLILAGGNYAWQHGQAASPEKEDGILTAYEISQMNLSNTELVVLSACETGLGDIQGNEGVYGLQRAFKIAGAKYLIMSLWQVPDRETMEFMTTFYRNWLPSGAEALAGKEEKMTIPDAFRKTQREMRDRFFNPYSWAGFVLVE